jgi:hypothetical protein
VHTQQRLGVIAKDASNAASMTGDALEEGYKFYAGGKILHGALGLFRFAPKFTAANFRANLIKSTGINPGAAKQAHHGLPQEFEATFNRLGIQNIHDPKYGYWVETATHQSKWHARYNATWAAYLDTNPTPKQIEKFLRLMMSTTP